MHFDLLSYLLLLLLYDAHILAIDVEISVESSLVGICSFLSEELKLKGGGVAPSAGESGRIMTLS